MATIPGRRTKQGPQVEQTAPPTDALSLLQQIASQLEGMNNLVGNLAQRVSALEVTRTQQVHAAAAPEIAPVGPRIDAPLTHADKVSVQLQAQRDVASEKAAFIERIQTQPKRKVVFAENWETEILGVPVFIRKGLRAVPEEVAQVYEAYIEKMQTIEKFNDQWTAVANMNSRDPGTMHYPDLEHVMRGLR